MSDIVESYDTTLDLATQIQGDVRYNLTIINEEREHVTHERITYHKVLSLVAGMNSTESLLITAYWDREAP